MLRICSLDSSDGNCNQCKGTGDCPSCKGTGKHPRYDDVQCPTCHNDKKCIFRTLPKGAIA
jgi:hypothetical protein